MGREEQIITERKRKMQELRENNINPYPHSYDVKNNSNEIKNKFDKLKNEERTDKKTKIAGRVIMKRDLGKLIFVTLQDFYGRIQIILQKQETDEKSFELFKKYVDVGDFIGVSGTIMKTKSGEVSILSKSIEMLSKSLLPLPDKWHGIQDKEERYRKRYLDLIMNPEIKEIFIKRSKIIKSLREFLESRGFFEVELPLIQPVYGGANAKPFVTHINALDLDAYLSISPELYLKRLIVGGYEKVFTICKNFRNEGIDFAHNPEFTMIEYYIAYKDYNYHIEFIYSFFKKLKKDLGIGDKINYRGKEISLKTPFKQIKFRDLFLQELEIDINVADNFEKLKKEISNKKIDIDIKGCKHYGSLLDEVYKRVIRPNLVQPTLLTHYPVEMIALAKRNDEDINKINTVQLIIDGAEIFKAYDELNDPIDQEQRFFEEKKLIEKGDENAMPMDSDFIESIKYGMPPTAGFGMGIDRLVMILTGQDSIRDVIFFPFMKPQQTENL